MWSAGCLQLPGAAKNRIGPEPCNLHHHGDLGRGQTTHTERKERHISWRSPKSYWTKVVDQPTVIPSVAKHTDNLTSLFSLVCLTRLHYIAKCLYFFVRLPSMWDYWPHTLHTVTQKLLSLTFPWATGGLMNAFVGGFRQPMTSLQHNESHVTNRAHRLSRSSDTGIYVPQPCAPSDCPALGGDTQYSCTAPLYFHMGEKADVCSHFSNHFPTV